MKKLKLFLWVTGLLAALAVGAVAVLVTLVDPNDYKPRIAEMVRENTGRDLQLHGDLDLTFFPWLGVQTGPLELSNRQGFGPAPMLAADNAGIRVKLLPLLKRRLEIGTVLLERPQLSLLRKTDGAANWDDLTARSRRHGDDHDGHAPPDAAVAAGLAVQGVSLVDGRVDWDDRTAGRLITLKALNLNTGKLTPGEPLDVDFSVEVEDSELPEPVAVTLKTTALLTQTLESISLDGTELQAIGGTFTAALSVETISYALRAGLAVFTGLAGDADHNGLDTRLEIPSITLNLSDETLQLPSVKLQQGDFSLTGSAKGARVLSDLAVLTADGSVDARFGDAADFLKRNRFHAGPLPGLGQPVDIDFGFALADRSLTLTDLAVKSPEAQGGAALVEHAEIVIPLEDDGALGLSGLRDALASLVQAQARQALHEWLLDPAAPATGVAGGAKEAAQKALKKALDKSRNFLKSLKGEE